jgi:hypothetical protein
MLNGLNWAATDDDQLTLIEGGARGADALADEWVTQDGGGDPIDGPFHLRYPADWKQHGKAAGPIRNKQMLDEGKPDLVVAFSDRPITPGTANMIKQAKAADVPVWVISHG